MAHREPTEAQLAISFKRRVGRWPTLESELEAERQHYLPVAATSSKPKGYRAVRLLEKENAALREQLAKAQNAPAQPLDTRTLTPDEHRRLLQSRGVDTSTMDFSAPTKSRDQSAVDRQIAAEKRQRLDAERARRDAVLAAVPAIDMRTATAEQAREYARKRGYGDFNFADPPPVAAELAERRKAHEIEHDPIARRRAREARAQELLQTDLIAKQQGKPGLDWRTLSSEDAALYREHLLKRR